MIWKSALGSYRPKMNMTVEKELLEKYLLSKTVIVHCHVSFQRCMLKFQHTDEGTLWGAAMIDSRNRNESLLGGRQIPPLRRAAFTAPRRNVWEPPLMPPKHPCSCCQSPMTPRNHKKFWLYKDSETKNSFIKSSTTIEANNNLPSWDTNAGCAAAVHGVNSVGLQVGNLNPESHQDFQVHKMEILSTDREIWLFWGYGVRLI